MAEETKTSDALSQQPATDDPVRIVQRLRDESKSARRPRELEWNRAWNLYNNVYDFSRKAGWQSKNFLPRINTSVRAASYIIRKGLTGPRDYFGMDGIGAVSKELAPTIHKLAKLQLEEGKFVERYCTALVSGMLSSLVILKIYPTMVDVNDAEYQPNQAGPLTSPPPRYPKSSLAYALGSESEPMQRGLIRRKRKRLKICYDPVSAYDYYPDPSGDNLYRIHSTEMDLHKFKMLMKDNPYADKQVLAQIEDDFTRIEEDLKKASQKQQDPSSIASPDMRRRVVVDEFWGDMPNLRGDFVMQNCYSMVVNEKYQVIAPRKNYLGGCDPFVCAPLIEKPFSTWHQGFVEGVAGLQIALVDTMNTILDASQYAGVKAFELDVDQVYDPTEFIEGIYPGKTYKKRGGGFNTAPMIKDISLGNLNPQLMEIYMALDRELQGGMGLNEFILPQMRVRTGRVSATETLQKGQNSSDFFAEIGAIQEEKVIVPSVQKTIQYMVEYQRDFRNDPIVVETIGPEAAIKADMMLADPEIREFLLSMPLKIKAFGISVIAERMKELDKIMGFINLIGNLAKAVPGIVGRVNIETMLKKAIQALNWDESEILVALGAPTTPGIVPPPPAGAAPAGAGVEPPPSTALAQSALQPMNAMQGGAGSISSALGG